MYHHILAVNLLIKSFIHICDKISIQHGSISFIEVCPRSFHLKFEHILSQLHPQE